MVVQLLPLGGHRAEQCAAAQAQILALLDERELRGVLGHELMHVYNHDILTSAIASALATIITYLGYSLMYFGGGRSRDDRDDSASGGLGLLGVLLSTILAPIAASLIQMAISRTREYDADEVGVLKLKMQSRDEIRAGDVGYICSGIKTSSDVKVGDTITSVENPSTEAIAGFEDVKPMVFAGVYPVEADQYEDLRASLEKLQLNDASLTFEPESSLALGFGFRCGFLGLLHMEIIQERLYREFDMDVITTVPNVSYKITTTQGDVLEVHNPSGLPEITKIASIEEPYILAQIITKSDFLGNVLKLCIDKRGIMKNQTFITQDRVEVNFEMPLSEIVFDFYDKLKSISKGYASFDYHRIGFRPSKLAKLDILLNGEPVDALSSLIYADHAYDFGRRMCEKLKELIPRQQFDIAIQAAIGAKIIARETVKAVRKDVTAKCYGGDISRKRKLLEKQKKGKKRMRQIGNVEVPQSAFLAVLKMD